jgi:nucleotide-binding universal stress UspA family protein
MSFFPTKILLAIDGSEEASLATEAATELSKNTASEVHLAYVVPTPERLAYPHHYPTEVREDIFEQAKKEAGKFLDTQAEQIRSGGGSVSKVHLRTGRPDNEIVSLSEDLGIGLIVIGSRGLTGMRRALMGSVSDSVVRHAHCPVMVVREEKRNKQ